MPAPLPTLARIAVTLMVAVAACATPRAAAAEWTRLTSEHFVFVGDASERQIRAVAVRLEQFRSAVARALAADTLGTQVPTVVLVFRNARSFQPFGPVYQGRPVAVAGYFAGSDDVNYVAVNGEQEAAAYGLIFHEFAHALSGLAMAGPPAWLDEGLAEFYESFELRDEGQAALLGAPNRDDLRLLQRAGLMPLAELFAVERDSHTYNEGDRRSLFYAQSWALVHYLTFGSAERGAQFRRYLELLARATPAADAFTQVFGAETAALEQELREYVTRNGLAAVRVDLERFTGAAGSWKASRIGEPEAAGYLGDAMARLGRVADARAYLQRAVAADAGAARATAALGLVEMQGGDDTVALPLLERAAALAPGDAWVQSAYGRALVRRAEQGSPADEAGYARARDVLTHALDLDRSDVPAAVTLAAVLLSQGTDPAMAVELLQPVVRAMPGRENYRLMLARAHAAHGDYASATALLGPLVARGSRPEMREAARELLADVVRASAGSSAPNRSNPGSQ